jgi:hypothetical protein
MRLETLPVLVGVLVTLVGLALVADAAIPDGALMRPERRRRPRPQRHHAGEAALGLGVACVGAALIGRDAWAYTTVAILAALVLGVVGVVLNWRYVRGMMLGDVEATTDASRRTSPGPAPTTGGTLPAAPHAPPPAAAADGTPRPERRLHAR